MSVISVAGGLTVPRPSLCAPRMARISSWLSPYIRLGTCRRVRPVEGFPSAASENPWTAAKYTKRRREIRFIKSNSLFIVNHKMFHSQRSQTSSQNKCRWYEMCSWLNNNVHWRNTGKTLKWMPVLWPISRTVYEVIIEILLMLVLF